MSPTVLSKPPLRSILVVIVNPSDVLCGPLCASYTLSFPSCVAASLPGCSSFFQSVLLSPGGGVSSVILLTVHVSPVFFQHLFQFWHLSASPRMWCEYYMSIFTLCVSLLLSECCISSLSSRMWSSLRRCRVVLLCWMCFV